MLKSVMIFAGICVFGTLVFSSDDKTTEQNGKPVSGLTQALAKNRAEALTSQKALKDAINELKKKREESSQNPNSGSSTSTSGLSTTAPITK